MRATPGTLHATVAMDVMPPWRAFGTLPTSATHDARRWLRPVLLTFVGLAALAVLIGASAREWTEEEASGRRAVIVFTS